MRAGKVANEFGGGKPGRVVRRAARPNSVAAPRSSERSEDGQPKPAGFGEMGMGKFVHGTLRSRVLARIISRANRPKAASRGHWKRGR